MGKPVENPASLRHALGQARLGQKAQVARDARLALAQHFGDLADRQLAFRQKGEQPQAGRFGGGSETVEKVIEGRHGQIIMRIQI